MQSNAGKGYIFQAKWDPSANKIKKTLCSQKKIMRHHLIGRLLFMLCLISTQVVYPQYYLGGQDPASIRWKQIQTGSFRIIFPAGMYPQAARLAFLTEQTSQAVNADYQASLPATDLILHTQTAISNASVAWAPHRLDYHYTPPQDGYSQEWLRQLSLHELRHLSQMSSLNKGFTKASSLILGQQGLAGILGMFVPNWFLEGDAVVIETAMSHSGRGRQSLFEAGLRAQLLEDKMYSYDKAYFGSYRHHVPNIYELGYFLVGYQRYKEGSELWAGMLNQIARNPFLLNPVGRALKKTSGNNKSQLYKQTLTELKHIWLQQDSIVNLTSLQRLSPQKKIYTNYRFATQLSDGSVIAIRTSKDDIARIVHIKNGTEQILFTPGSLFNESLSCSDSLVVWNEYQADIRWSNQNYSVIKIGEINSGKISQLSYHSRLFVPDISYDNKKIVASEILENGSYGIAIVKVNDGQKISLSQNDSLFFQTPIWMKDNIHIAATAVGRHGKALVKIHSISGELTILLPFTYDDFSLSGILGNNLLLHGSWTGISNIFLFETATSSVRQLTSSRFGAAWAYGDEERGLILYSDYHSTGWQLVLARLSESLDLPLEAVERAPFQLAELLSESTSFNIDTLEIPDTLYTVKPYNKLTHLFRFHSWAPLYIEADNATFQPGLSLFSQNSLSTMITELGYIYDPNQQTGTTKASISYYGWYPVITASFEYGLRRDEAILDDELIRLKWHETQWIGSVSLPLNLTRNKWLRGVRPLVGFQQTYRDMDKDINLKMKHPLIRVLRYEIQAYQYMRMSERDLIPKTGVSVYALFRHSLFDGQAGQQLYASTNLFLPGFSTNHGIRLFGAWQKKTPEDAYFSSLTPIPRGYNSIFYPQAISFKADYMFPLAYPEWNWPTICYLKRIRAGGFYDYLQAKQPHNDWTNFSSAGVEIFSDWHFFNFPAPLTLGARISYAFDKASIIPEFLFGVNFDAIR